MVLVAAGALLAGAVLELPLLFARSFTWLGGSGGAAPLLAGAISFFKSDPSASVFAAAGSPLEAAPVVFAPGAASDRGTGAFAAGAAPPATRSTEI